MIHLNASDDRGIDVIRNQINQFVNTKTLFGNGMKFVILDEVDYMTKNAQQALRYLIQKYSNFFKMKKLEIDQEVLSETSNLQLLSTLAMLAPFNKIDKQAILESKNVMERLNTINSILDLNTFQVVSTKNNSLN